MISHAARFIPHAAKCGRYAVFGLSRVDLRGLTPLYCVTLLRLEFSLCLIRRCSFFRRLLPDIRSIHSSAVPFMSHGARTHYLRHLRVHFVSLLYLEERRPFGYFDIFLVFVASFFWVCCYIFRHLCRVLGLVLFVIHSASSTVSWPGEVARSCCSHSWSDFHRFFLTTRCSFYIFV